MADILLLRLVSKHLLLYVVMEEGGIKKEEGQTENVGENISREEVLSGIGEKRIVRQINLLLSLTHTL